MQPLLIVQGPDALLFLIKIRCGSHRTNTRTSPFNDFGNLWKLVNIQAKSQKLQTDTQNLNGASIAQRLDPQSFRRAGQPSEKFGRGFWEGRQGELLRTWDTSSQNLEPSSENPMQNFLVSPEYNQMHASGHHDMVLRHFGQGFSELPTRVLRTLDKGSQNPSHTNF